MVTVLARLANKSWTGHLGNLSEKNMIFPFIVDKG